MSEVAENDETGGVETLAAANYQAFEDEIDKVSAQCGVDRVELRDAIGHMVDHGIDEAADAHDVSREIILDARNACRRAAKNQYPEYYHD